MKRCALAIVFTVGLMACASPAIAQEATHEEAVEKGKSGLSLNLELALLVVNFALLAGGLVYLTKKYGGPFLTARSQKISHDIVEATRIRKDAEAQAAEVDRRLASLETDLAALRAESQKEIESQKRHVADRTTAELAKIQAHAEQEIASAGKLARMELKRYSADLAVNLAGQKIQARMTPETQEALVRGFVKDLDHPSATAHTN